MISDEEFWVYKSLPLFQVRFLVALLSFYAIVSFAVATLSSQSELP